MTSPTCQLQTVFIPYSFLVSWQLVLLLPGLLFFGCRQGWGWGKDGSLVQGRQAEHPGIQMKSSSWEWLQAGQYCILPGFVLLWSSQGAHRLNSGTWSSKVVGIFVIIIEDFRSNF